MQCPETPQISILPQAASSCSTTIDTGTLRKRNVAVDDLERSPSSGRGPNRGSKTPCDGFSEGLAGQDGPLRAKPPATTNFSRRLNRQHQSNDIFQSRNRSSAAVLQFHDAARRLALSPISPSTQNQDSTEKNHAERLRRHYNSPPAEDRSPGKNNSRHSRYSDSQALADRDITSARKEILYRQSTPGRNPSTPLVAPSSFNHGSPAPFRSRKNRGQVRRTMQRHQNFSRPTRPLQSSSAKPAARNFSRPVRSLRPTPGQRSGASTPKKLDYIENTFTPPQSVDQRDHASLSISLAEDSTVLTPEAGDLHTALHDTTSNEHVQVQRQPSETSSVHLSTRESFESAVSECLGDKRLQLSNWEIWLQRLFFLAFVFTANIALGLAYLGAFKHPYMLAILAFMKCKDILSTVAIVVGLLHKFLRELIWRPKVPDSRWILCLVCAYAETEEQILKTVYSLAGGNTRPHKQAICIILDGKPRDILGKMSEVKVTVQRPYTTWRGNRGEITVYAGYLKGTPLVLVEKAKNAGKKDSLILGHDLFNFPRKDMPYSTKMLRQEVWQTVMPTIITTSGGAFEKFDFIFCTDADSTIHDEALQKLANALCREDNAMAACGVLFAEFADGWAEYAPWHLFQQFQYTFGQYVRRQAESVWGRVTCMCSSKILSTAANIVQACQDALP